MSDQYVAEIRIFAGNFAPVGWALCNGQSLPISQNAALFSLIGTFYGGNGTTVFSLPNLQGCLPLGMGSGPGLTPRVVGETGGEPTVTLLTTQMPAHSHTALADTSGGNDSPANAAWGESKLGKTPLPAYAASDAGALLQMSPAAISSAGGSQPHNNLPPYLTVTFIIALQGIFPSRS